MSKRRGHASGDKRDVDEGLSWERTGFEGTRGVHAMEEKYFFPKEGNMEI